MKPKSLSVMLDVYNKALREYRQKPNEIDSLLTYGQTAQVARVGGVDGVGECTFESGRSGDEGVGLAGNITIA